MRLAFNNLYHDRLRFCVTIVGIAFSIFLMVFEGSLLAGFIRAASRVVDASDADLWISARGVPCFEFSTPLPSRFREISMGTLGVTSVQRFATGVAIWQKPTGMRQIVQVIGADPGVGEKFPLPFLHRQPGVLESEVVLVDRSNAPVLEVDAPGVEVEINHLRARVDIIDGFGSFSGQPYIFTNYADAIRYLGKGREETELLTVHVSPKFDVKKVQYSLQEKLPEVNVWTQQEFASRSQHYWIVQTGAGSALLTAVLLGFVVGVVVVSQSIYATTMENIEEFATLKAIGASGLYIKGVVIIQALICGIIGSVVGLAGTVPLVDAIRGVIPWVYMPSWLPLGMIGISLVMCVLASLVSVRKAVVVEPGRVFRA